MSIILIPCHAILNSEGLQRNEIGDYDVLFRLQNFQQGEGLIFVEHIRQAVILMKNDPESVLIFSGGKTNISEDISEGQSYLNIMNHLHLGDFIDSTRFVTEEYALDSFQNLLFSIAKYYCLHKTFPKKIVIIGWGFKRARFEFHMQTIFQHLNIDIEDIEYEYIAVGTPPGNLVDITQSELATLLTFQKDPFGSSHPTLVSKRKERNPFFQSEPYSATIHHPEFQSLLQTFNDLTIN